MLYLFWRAQGNIRLDETERHKLQTYKTKAMSHQDETRHPMASESPVYCYTYSKEHRGM